MSYLTIGDCQLYYEITGAGHPLVMLHGHLLDSGQWDDQVTAFAPAYQTIRYDARGFGQSTLPPALYAHHKDLYALLRHLAITLLSALTAPTLVIVGGEDQPPLHDIADLLTTQVAGAQKIIIPNAGHHPNLEQVSLFNQAVQSFLQKVDVHNSSKE